MKTKHLVLSLAAVGAGVIGVIGGCNDSNNGLTASNPSGQLIQTEEWEINVLRNYSYYAFERALLIDEQDRSNLTHDTDLDESAIAHTGYLQSVTKETDQAVPPGLEPDGSLPMWVGGDPFARAAAAGFAGAVPPNEVDEIYLRRPHPNGSRVLNVWYSRKGRLGFLRNASRAYGFGSVQLARKAWAALGNTPPIPAEGTNIPIPGANNPFMDGDFHGTFAIWTSAAIYAGASTIGSMWPSSNDPNLPLAVFAGEGTDCEFGNDSPPGTMLTFYDNPVVPYDDDGPPLVAPDSCIRHFEPDTLRPGYPIYGLPIHIAVASGSITGIDDFKIGYSTTPLSDALAYPNLSPATNINVWMDHVVPISLPNKCGPAAKIASGAVLYHDGHTVDGDYLPSEVFFVPTMPLKVGYYAVRVVLTASETVDPQIFTMYFYVTRQRLR